MKEYCTTRVLREYNIMQNFWGQLKWYLCYGCFHKIFKFRMNEII